MAYSLNIITRASDREFGKFLLEVYKNIMNNFRKFMKKVTSNLSLILSYKHY